MDSSEEILEDSDESVLLGGITPPNKTEESQPSSPVVEDPRLTMPEEAIMREGRGKPRLVKLKGKTVKETYGHGNPTHEKRLKVAERSAEVYNLRLQGWTIREIAFHYEVSASWIDRIIRRELDAVNKRATLGAEHLRLMMEERLDMMFRAIAPQIQKGNLRSVEMGLKIFERQAKLQGLDAPEKKQIDLNIDLSDAEIVAQARRAGIKDIPPELLALVGEAPLAIMPLGIIVDAEYTVIETNGQEKEVESKSSEPLHGEAESQAGCPEVQAAEKEIF